MSPRPYQAGPRRQQATQATRSRIIEAARELLAHPGAQSFSVDAVAERADVARMTVYYQFKSKGGLLEALFEDFAARANMRDLRKAFMQPEPDKSVSTLVDVFCHLWETQRPVLRRLTALAMLDPEVEKALSERGGRRREALTQLIARAERARKPEQIVDAIHVLTSFETYDALAAAGRSPAQIAATIKRAAAALLREVQT